MKAKINIIAIIVVIWLVFLSCATATKTGMNVTATGTSEGISLHFSNIPKDTIRLFVFLEDVTVNNQPPTFVGIVDDELAELKKTKNLLCPFVYNGHEYVIDVFHYSKLGADKKYNVSAIAGGGINLTNNPLLTLTDKNSVLTLSEMPVFSEEGLYSQKYPLFTYDISVIIGSDGYRSGGSAGSNELTFPIQTLTETIKENVELTGDEPLVGVLFCNLNYENLNWTVGVAQTEKIIVSF